MEIYDGNLEMVNLPKNLNGNTAAVTVSISHHTSSLKKRSFPSDIINNLVIFVCIIC